MQQQRPIAVKDVTVILAIDAGGFIFVASFLLLISLLLPPNSRFNQDHSIAVIALGIGVIYAILALGFYNLRPWAYRAVKILVRIDRLSSGLGLYKKLEQPEVLHVFGMDDNAKAR